MPWNMNIICVCYVLLFINHKALLDYSGAFINILQGVFHQPWRNRMIATNLKDSGKIGRNQTMNKLLNIIKIVEKEQKHA